ncbi:hypothetical protein ACJW31_06G231600 [Castanea mollissima]
MSRSRFAHLSISLFLSHFRFVCVCAMAMAQVHHNELVILCPATKFNWGGGGEDEVGQEHTK